MEIYNPPKHEPRAVYSGGDTCPYCKNPLSPRLLKIESALGGYKYRCRSCNNELQYRLPRLIMMPSNLLAGLLILVILAVGLALSFDRSFFYLVPMLAALWGVYTGFSWINKMLLIRFSRIKHYV